MDPISTIKILESKNTFKDYSYQFLPKSLSYLSKSEKIKFNTFNLKTSYLIDIMHNLLLKFYFTKNNSIELASKILKKKYGQYYSHYMNYLIQNEYIFLIKDYFKGEHSKTYSISSKIINSEISRYQNYNKFLLRKINNKVFQNTSSNKLITSAIKDKLIDDLYHVDINIEKSYKFIESLKKDNIDSYNKNKFSIDSIDNKNIFYHFDNYGRVHTNFTILKGFIRKNYLLIDNEPVCEIDISNSQPLFLSNLIKYSDTKWVDKDEYELFRELVVNGCYYDYLIDNLSLKDRKSAKDLTYKVFFGQNRNNSKSDKMFIKLFPTIHNYIVLYKKDFHDYRILAQHLQRFESDIIFNKIVSKIMILNPSIRIITIHDSLIVQERWREAVSKIFYDEISNC